MKAKHTRGPWSVDDKFTVYSSATLQSIARVQPEPEQEANARLVASAPDLLDALREVTDAYEKLRIEYGKPFGWGRITTDEALKVIAKAIGENYGQTEVAPDAFANVEPGAVSPTDR